VAFRDYCSLFALGLSLAACKGGEHTTDPAGVIQLDEPITVIGGGAERDGHLLYRVAGAILDQEGNLLIADGGSGELRVFGTDGELLKRLGGLGDGPAELSGIWAKNPDTVFAYDAGSSRLSVWTTRGGFVQRFPVRRGISIAGMADNGIVIVQPPEPVPLDPSSVGATSTRLDSAHLLLYHRVCDDLHLLDTLMAMPWRTRVVTRTPTGAPIGMNDPLGARGYAQAHARMLYLGYSGNREIRVHTLGGPSFILDPGIRKRAFTGDLRNAWEEHHLKEVSAPQRPAMRRYLRSIQYPDSLPAYDSFSVTADGVVILRRFALPHEQEAVWRVVLEDRMTVEVTLSGQSRPLDLKGDNLVVHRISEVSGEQVVVYRVNWNGTRRREVQDRSLRWLRD
jgi:hypothetical protein